MNCLRGTYFCDLKMVAKIRQVNPSQTLMNLQYTCHTYWMAVHVLYELMLISRGPTFNWSHWSGPSTCWELLHAATAVAMEAARVSSHSNVCLWKCVVSPDICIHGYHTCQQFTTHLLVSTHADITCDCHIHVYYYIEPITVFVLRAMHARTAEL